MTASANAGANSARAGAPILPVHYVLPMRWSEDKGLAELADYLESIREFVDVIVVDGSDPDRRRQHRAALPEDITVLDCANTTCLNGKVAGVLTAVPMLHRANTVIADDDVRYEPEDLFRIVGELDRADLVIPQNHFSAPGSHRVPWHARWDTARSLLNRAFGSDYPGTLALRTTMLADGYDGDVLFENLELIRTVKARGGIVRSVRDLFVARRPPSFAGFAGQRIRQAYDSCAQPLRFLVELSLLPLAVASARRPRCLAAMVVLVIGIAEVGRRRASGTSVFPASASFWAPLWVAERAVCAWWALALRLRGGVTYHGRRIPVAAHSQAQLRKVQHEPQESSAEPRRTIVARPAAVGPSRKVSEL